MCTSYVRISMLIWMPRIEPRIGQIIPRRTSSIWYSFCKNSWLWAENVFFWLGNMFFGIIANRNELVPPKNQLFKKPTFQPKTYFRPKNQIPIKTAPATHRHRMAIRLDLSRRNFQPTRGQLLPIRATIRQSPPHHYKITFMLLRRESWPRNGGKRRQHSSEFF